TGARQGRAWHPLDQWTEIPVLTSSFRTVRVWVSRGRRAGSPNGDLAVRCGGCRNPLVGGWVWGVHQTGGASPLWIRVCGGGDPDLRSAGGRSSPGMCQCAQRLDVVCGVTSAERCCLSATIGHLSRCTTSATAWFGMPLIPGTGICAQTALL